MLWFSAPPGATLGGLPQAAIEGPEETTRGRAFDVFEVARQDAARKPT